MNELEEEENMTLEENTTRRNQRTNQLKSEIDELDFEQCRKTLKYLSEKTGNKDGSPTVLMINEYDDLFVHVMADALEHAKPDIFKE